MESAKIILNYIMDEYSKSPVLYKRNAVKQYLQILVLDYIYSHEEYSQLIFYGGSCLAHCYNLPRLSEDLDFINIGNKADSAGLAADLKVYFDKNTDLKLITSVQKFRIYLKFPLLHELKLAKESESNLIFLKMEIYPHFEFCTNFKTDIIPLFKFNKTILIKTLDLPTLMSTKIRAVLNRRWEKTDKKGRILIRVKGRDYFDLLWYLQKNVTPNFKCLENIKDKLELKKELLKTIDNIDPKSIQLDLEAFITNAAFIKNLSTNIKNMLKRHLANFR